MESERDQGESRKGQILEEEEVSLFGLADVLVKSSRKLRFLAVVFGLALVLLFFVYLYLNARNSFIRYSVELSLQFKGINDQKYPDGSSFNPNDIVNADILARVYKKNNLSNIDFSNFVSAFFASYKNVFRPSIVQEEKAEGIKKKVGTKTEKEIFKVINPSMVRIYLDSQKQTFFAKDLLDNERQKILTDIPLFWSEKFKKIYLSRNIPNPLNLIDFDRLLTREYGDIYNTLDDNLEKFIESVESLKEERSISSFKSASLDMTLDEALFVVKNMIRRDLSAWYSIPKSFGIFKNEEKRRAILIKEFSDLSKKHEVLARKNLSFENVLTGLRNPQAVTGSAQAFAQDKAGSRTTQADKMDYGIQAPAGGQIPLLDSTLMERIFKSGETSTFAKYVQELTDRLLEGVSELAGLELSLAQVKSELAVFENRERKLSQSRKKEMIKEIEAELRDMIENYKKWMSICVQIVKENTDVEFIKQGNIYSIISPVQETLVNPSTGKSLFRKIVVIPAVLMVLAFVGYCGFLIFRHGYQAYIKESES